MGFYIAAFGNASAGRVSLCDEDATILFSVSFGIIEMDAAVTQLLVVQVGFLRTFAGKFRNSGNSFPVSFVFVDFLLYDFGNVRILM